MNKINYVITRPHHAINGHETKSELMRHTDSGQLYFRAYFERWGFESLIINSVSDAFKILDEAFNDMPKLIAVPGHEFDEYRLLGADSEGDRTFYYWADLEVEK